MEFRERCIALQLHSYVLDLAIKHSVLGRSCQLGYGWYFMRCNWHVYRERPDYQYKLQSELHDHDASHLRHYRLSSRPCVDSISPGCLVVQLGHLECLQEFNCDAYFIPRHYLLCRSRFTWQDFPTCFLRSSQRKLCSSCHPQPEA